MFIVRLIRYKRIESRVLGVLGKGAGAWREWSGFRRRSRIK